MVSWGYWGGPIYPSSYNLVYVGSVLGRFWVDLGSISGRSGVDSGSVWDRFEVTLGSIWGHFWVGLRSNRVFGPMLEIKT